MNSFKSLGRLIIFVAALTVLFTLGINSQTSKAFDTLDANERTIDDLTSYISNNELPLRVFRNIAQQNVTDEKYDALAEAFDVNKENFELRLNDFLKESELLEFESYELVLYEINPKEKKELEQRLSILRHDVESMLMLMDKHFDVPVIRSMDSVQVLEDKYFLVREELIGFHNVYNKFSDNIRGQYIFVYNGLIYIAVALIAFMGFVVFRMIRSDLKFISKTYQQLEHHDYDVEKILPKNPIFREEIEIYNTVEKMFNEQKTLEDIKNLVSQTYHMDDIIDTLYESLDESFGIDRVGIAFIDYRRGYIKAEYGVSSYDNMHLGPGYEVLINNSSLKRLINNPHGIINNDVPFVAARHPNSLSLDLINREGIGSNMIIPLVSNNVVFGFIFVSSLNKGHFTDEHLRLSSKIVYEIGGPLNRSYLLKVVLAKMTTTFAKLVDRKDNETGDHLLRMVKYSTIIAEGVRKLNLLSHPMDKKTILEIERHASVHDIGKVGIPDDILKKPGKLTSEEWEIMKTHVTIGGEIFSELRSDFGMFDQDFYKVAEQIVKFHHEKFDGSGYPYKLRGQEIPLVARIVALADVFDALTSERVYKKAYSFEKALDIIDDSSGHHFDPVIVSAFMNEIDAIMEVYNKNL